MSDNVLILILAAGVPLAAAWYERKALGSVSKWTVVTLLIIAATWLIGAYSIHQAGVRQEARHSYAVAMQQWQMVHPGGEFHHAPVTVGGMFPVGFLSIVFGVILLVAIFSRKPTVSSLALFLVAIFQVVVMNFLANDL